MTDTRTRDGFLQTPIRHYVADGKPEIVLVGTVHVGSADYYADLKSRIEEYALAGYGVHYEAVQATPADELERATPRERAAVTKLQSLRRLTEGFATVLQLPTQHVWAPVPKHWRNVDVTDLDIARAHGGDLDFIGDAVASVERISDLDERETAVLRHVSLLAIQHRRLIGKPLAVARQLGLVRGGTFDESYILDHRNGVAVEAALSEDRPVVTVWGAAHLAGMARLMRPAGYRLQSEQWVDALPTARWRDVWSAAVAS